MTLRHWWWLISVKHIIKLVLGAHVTLSHKHTRITEKETHQILVLRNWGLRVKWIFAAMVFSVIVYAFQLEVLQLLMSHLFTLRRHPLLQWSDERHYTNTKITSYPVRSWIRYPPLPRDRVSPSLLHFRIPRIYRIGLLALHIFIPATVTIEGRTWCYLVYVLSDVNGAAEISMARVVFKKFPKRHPCSTHICFTIPSDRGNKTTVFYSVCDVRGDAFKLLNDILEWNPLVFARKQ